MGVVHGKNGVIKVGANDVAEVRRMTVTQTVETADSTVMEDTAQTHTTGIPGWSGRAECLLDPADTNGQVALTIGASVTIGFYPQGDGSGATYYTGTATVTSIERDTDFQKNGEFTCELQGNGGLTITTV